jgi:hypothetical protein
MALTDISHDRDVGRLVQALTKSGTIMTMQKSQVMPIKNFCDLFYSWPRNELLDIKRLRLKAITLLALVGMLRPSDIAPKTVIFDPETMSTSNVVLSTDDVSFHEDGSLTLTLHGIKNDTTRSGFEIDIPGHSDPVVDPVQTLRIYIERTDRFRHNGDLFIQLQEPYKAISAATVSKVLDESIKLAGLPANQYSAKSFRPTGATTAIEEGYDANKVMKVGRWKTQSVFYDHYVHNKTPNSFTDSIIH